MARVSFCFAVSSALARFVSDRAASAASSAAASASLHRSSSAEAYVRHSASAFSAMARRSSATAARRRAESPSISWSSPSPSTTSAPFFFIIPVALDASDLSAARSRSPSTSAARNRVISACAASIAAAGTDPSASFAAIAPRSSRLKCSTARVASSKDLALTSKARSSSRLTDSLSASLRVSSSELTVVAAASASAWGSPRGDDEGPSASIDAPRDLVIWFPSCVFILVFAKNVCVSVSIAYRGATYLLTPFAGCDRACTSPPCSHRRPPRPRGPASRCANPPSARGYAA